MSRLGKGDQFEFVRTAANLDSSPPVECGAASPPFSMVDTLSELERYDVLDTPREEGFDRITRLVCNALSVPISTVTFLDGHRQWFKSRRGFAQAETARDIAFCQIPVAENRLLVVPDTHADPRFRDNPLVVDGPRLRFYAGAPIRASSGRCLGTLCAMDTQPRTLSDNQITILEDLARVVETELEWRLLATTDVLTGALARRAFLEEGERAVALAVRHRQKIACIYLDLDHFKAINDAYGHGGGDKVLAATARTCAAQLRKSDVFGRLGGEEFVILLPQTDAAQAFKVAEKLRASVEAQGAALTGVDLKTTASFGVSNLSPATPNLTDMLAAADAAMYVAKSRGRNCCVLAEPPPSGAAAGDRKVLKAGKMVFNFGQSVIDCTVRRLSDTGARLDVLSTADVPASFKLNIDSDGFSRASRVLHKSEKQIDVAFT